MWKDGLHRHRVSQPALRRAIRSCGAFSRGKRHKFIGAGEKHKKGLHSRWAGRGE